MLLLRFDGVLLFRFATRQFLALLFQLPPRFTRLEPLQMQSLSCRLLAAEALRACLADEGHQAGGTAGIFSLFHFSIVQHP